MLLRDAKQDESILRMRFAAPSRPVEAVNTSQKSPGLYITSERFLVSALLANKDHCRHRLFLCGVVAIFRMALGVSARGFRHRHCAGADPHVHCLRRLAKALVPVPQAESSVVSGSEW